MYETGDINNKDFMSLCENDKECSVLTELLMKETSKEDIEKLTSEIARKIEVEKLQKRKNELIKSMQNARTDDERELLMAEINDLVLKLAKR